MFRIISGRWKAKKIAAPKNFDVRPTTDFAKEALFSILEHRYDLPYVAVLDLFAGIGSISLEFASRDTQDITAVENNARHAGFISQTAHELELSLQISVLRYDVYEYLKKNQKKKAYDIVFADPPFEQTDEKKYLQLIDQVLQGEYLKPGGVFILEHAARLKLQHPAIEESRKYGNLNFSFIPYSEPVAKDNENSATEDEVPGE